MESLKLRTINAKKLEAARGLALLGSALLGLSLLSTSTFANAGEALAKKNACFACHATETKVLGPSFKEVAKNYSGQENAAAKLAASIKAGGTGKWGNTPMPSQEHISPADTLAMATWILTIK
jgi:cytochrome c